MAHRWFVASLLVGILFLAGCIVVPVHPFGWGYHGEGGHGGPRGYGHHHERRGGPRW